MKQQLISSWKRIAIIGVSLIGLIIYHVLYDLIIIMAVLCSAYAIGNIFNIRGKSEVRELLRFSVGLGILGVIIYFILFWGIGSKSVYMLLIVGSIMFQRQKICNEIHLMLVNIKEYTSKHRVSSLILWGVIAFYIFYASSPIDKYDTLTKHLPIAISAAKTGAWNTNVLESIVYGESMVLQYTFSAVFVTFNAYKALAVFNVVLFIFCYYSLQLFCENLFGNFKAHTVLAIIVFSTPIFMEFATCYYLEILPLLFLVVIVTCVTSNSGNELWSNIPFLAWLGGCAIFSKLTISYSILVVAMIAFIRIANLRKSGRTMREIFIKSSKCILCLFGPFIFSVLNIAYKTGNPVFPFFNGIFKSPYFPMSNFEDPFQNRLGLNILSLRDMIFHTSKNIEMADGGLGIFLLFIAFILISIFMSRSKKQVVSMIACLVAFQISCFFTSNIRYSISIIFICAALVSGSCEEVLNKLMVNRKMANQFIYCTICLCILIPNVIYIYKNYNLLEKLTPSTAITNTENMSVLKEIPQNKKVFSLNDPFKGEYQGYFNAYMWHNQYNVDRIESGDISLNDYVDSFDYVLCAKNMELSDIEKQYLQNADNQLELISESQTHLLYKVHKNMQEKIVVSETCNPIQESTINDPLVYSFTVNESAYSIEQKVENTQNDICQMRFQINWMNSKGELIDVFINVYDLEPGIHTNMIHGIIPPDGATVGLLYVSPHDDSTIKVYKYSLTGMESTRSDLEEQEDIYISRGLLS